MIRSKSEPKPKTEPETETEPATRNAPDESTPTGIRVPDQFSSGVASADFVP